MAFVLCWLPFHVGRYLSSKSSEANSPLISQISEYCSLISFVLFYLSAAINPILYNIMSNKYRIAACKLFGMKHSSERSATVKTESVPGWGESSGNTYLGVSWIWEDVGAYEFESFPVMLTEFAWSLSMSSKVPNKIDRNTDVAFLWVRTSMSWTHQLVLTTDYTFYSPPTAL